MLQENSVTAVPMNKVWVILHDLCSLLCHEFSAADEQVKGSDTQSSLVWLWILVWGVQSHTNCIYLLLEFALPTGNSLTKWVQSCMPQKIHLGMSISLLGSHLGQVWAHTNPYQCQLINLVLSCHQALKLRLSFDKWNSSN